MRNILSLLIVVFSLSLYSQQKNIELDNSDSQTPGVYEARDYVKLLPDYTYNAQNAGGTMIGRIDETIVLPVDYISQSQVPDADNYQIDKSLSVGKTNGVVNVSKTGAATYNIPIYIPAGTSGIQPSISVAYNSQAGNGLLGRGWNLSGISAISRVNKTIYHDGKVGGVRLNNNDKFAVDGNRLFIKSGTYGQDGATYKKELNDFSNITSYGQSGNGPAYFIIETKNGNTIKYGNTSDSKLKSSSGNSIVSWFINRIEDRNGNYITFHYKNENNECVIEEIHYTGNDNNGSNTYNVVKFLYEEQTSNSSIIYINDSYIKRTKLLRKIKVSSFGSVVREYDFAYSEDQNHTFSKLVEIKESGKNNDELNSTVINYGENNYEFGNSQALIGSNSNCEYFSGDYNGDGRTDVIKARYTEITNNCNYADVCRAYTDIEFYTRNDINNNFNYLGSIPVEHNQSDYEYTRTGGFIGLVPDLISFSSSDFNGDSKDELLCINKYYDGTYSRVDEFILYKYESGNITTETIDINSATYNYNIISPNSNYYFQGDFTGDGNTDFITCLSNQNGYKPVLYDVSQDVSNEIGGMYGTEIIQADQVLVVDFNGNGKQELMIIKDYNCKIYEFTNYSLNCVYDIIYDNGYPTKDHKIAGIGDFNGDGKTDILYNIPSDDPQKWYIGFSTGGGNHFNEEYRFNYSIIKDPTMARSDFVTVGDFNGDQKSDVAFIKEIGLTSSQFHIHYGNELYFSYESFASDAIIDDEFHIGDFNGDGNSDILNRISDYNNNVFYFNINSREKLVTKICDGYNNKAEFTYETLPRLLGSEYNQCYNGDCYESFPMYVVTNSLIDNGISSQGYNEVSYKYTGAYFNKEKKSFLGFMQTEAEKLSPSRKIINTYTLFHNNTMLMPLITEVTDGTSTDISMTVNTHDKISITAKSIYPYTKTTHNYDYINGNDVLTTNTVNSDGNIINKNVNINSGELIKDIELTYTGAGLSIPYLVDSKTNTESYEGKPSFSKSVDFTYNFTNGRLMNKKLVEDDVTKYYLNYNAFGLAKTIKTSSTGIADRIVNIDYGSYGRFVKSKTNVLGHTEYFEYEKAIGKVKRKTDINGNITRYKYDNFGRLVKTISPEGLASFVSYNWYNGQNIENALFYTLSEADNLPYKKIYYDKLGRSLRSENESSNGIILADKKYDTNGNLDMESDPYFSGATPKWHYYDYYIIDNRLKEHIYQGNITDYTYSNNSTTISTPSNRDYTKTFDGAGNILQSDFPMSNTVNFDYGSHGNITETTANSVITNMGYDAVGMQSNLNDVDAGNTQYEYNNLGELEKQTDAKGNIYDISVDQYGRVDYYERPEGTTDYSYISSGNGLEKVEKIEAPSGYKSEYSYDQYSRVTEEKEFIDGQYYNHTYDYDNEGKLEKEIYPSGFAINYEYNNLGELISVSRDDNGQKIWYCDDYNENMQPLEIFYGDNNSNLKTTCSYDEYSRPEIIKVLHSSNILYNTQFNFSDLTGNLTWRADLKNNITENFTYDYLDRLTSWQVDGLQPYQIQYDVKGNILNKTDVGDFSYHGTKVHALTRVQNPTPIISEITQDISYTSFNKTEIITEGNNVLNIIYGPEDYRKKTVLYNNGSPVNTKIFAGNYEKEITSSSTKEYHYISGPTGLIAVYIIEDGIGQLYYTVTDHLGSIVQILDENGNIIEEANYGPWGRYRDPNTWEYDDNAGLTLLNRGYTGHEHLNEFALINMNGRMYDPVLGRMLSPDNYVQDPNNPQNYNRYAYCLNNPLIYTDPSGELVWFVPVAIGATVGAYAGASIQSGTPAFWDWQPDAWKGAIVGGLIGATAGAMFSAAMAPTAFGSASGFHTTGMVAGGKATAGWGITTSTLQGSSINMAMTGIQGGDIDALYKSGLVGAASGAWTATGGLGLVKQGIGGKLGYQMIGTTGRSIGKNWATGASSWEELTQRVVIGTGPVNLNYTRGKGIGVDWRDNIGNIITNSIGIANLATGGGVRPDWNNLTLRYHGGMMGKIMSKYASATGVYAMGSPNRLRIGSRTHLHEAHHIWQSRSMGSIDFMPNYFFQLGLGSLMGRDGWGSANWYEAQAYGYYWFR